MKSTFRTASLCFLALCTLAVTAIAQEEKKSETKPAQEAKPAKPKELNASHILIQWAGSERGTATRTKEEALKIATDLAAQAKKDGTLAGFEKLAAEKSDGPSKSTGGDLGDFPPGRMIPEFSAATMKLKIDEISEPVESKFGYHVIRRKKVVGKMAASHIVVAWKGSRFKPTETRSKEDALKLAKEIAQKAKAKDAKFEDLIKQYSDGPDKDSGGSLGVFSSGSGMLPSIWWTTSKLKIGETSEPIESQIGGYHVILRKKLPPPPRVASSKHILIQWKDSMRAKDKGITRTKEEAMALINECIAKLKKGEKFEDLAKQYSDGPSGPGGGDLGSNAEGRMVPAFDAALFKLKVGETSGAVETPFGYHLIYRYK